MNRTTTLPSKERMHFMNLTQSHPKYSEAVAGLQAGKPIIALAEQLGIPAEPLHKLRKQLETKGELVYLDPVDAAKRKLDSAERERSAVEGELIKVNEGIRDALRFGQTERHGDLRRKEFELRAKNESLMVAVLLARADLAETQADRCEQLQPTLTAETHQARTELVELEARLKLMQSEHGQFFQRWRAAQSKAHTNNASRNDLRTQAERLRKQANVIIERVTAA